MHITKNVSSTLFKIVVQNPQLSPLLNLSFGIYNYLPCLLLNPAVGLKGTMMDEKRNSPFGQDVNKYTSYMNNGGQLQNAIGTAFPSRAPELTPCFSVTRSLVLCVCFVDR